jgi:hypothetical protein
MQQLEVDVNAGWVSLRKTHFLSYNFFINRLIWRPFSVFFRTFMGI